MDSNSFKNFASFIQDTQSIIQNLELRRKAYSEFNLVFDYLAKNGWEEENLVEMHEYNEGAVFQNIAEGYFRLGFIEDVFFQYSKLIYELWYEKVIQEQERIHKRIHKGTQVHQIAEIYGIQNKFSRAWDYYIAGFIEDIIEGRNYTQSQAFRALIRQGLNDENLQLVSHFISKLKDEQKKDPLQIVETLKRKYIVPTHEENDAIDYIKLSKARGLWKVANKERKKNGDK